MPGRVRRLPCASQPCAPSDTSGSRVIVTPALLHAAVLVPPRPRAAPVDAVLVVGSDALLPPEGAVVHAALDAAAPTIVLVPHGYAGAPVYVQQWCQAHRQALAVTWHASWEAWFEAGRVRNEAMVASLRLFADRGMTCAVLAFPRAGRGITEDCIARARRAGIEVREY